MNKAPPASRRSRLADAFGEAASRRTSPGEVCVVVFCAALASALATQPARAQVAATVSVDLRPLGPRAFRELKGSELERGLVVRLVRDGFAVVAWSSSAEVRLSFARTQRGVKLTASGPAGDAAREVVVRKEPIVELHFELAQKAVELVRSTLEARPATPPLSTEMPEKRETPASPAPPPAPTTAKPAPTPTPAKPAPAPRTSEPIVAVAPLPIAGPTVHVAESRPRPHAYRFVVGAALGSVLRSGGSDVFAQGELRVRVWRNVELIGSFGWTGADDNGVRSSEYQLLAGPGVSWRLFGDSFLSVGLLGGVLLHVADPSGAASTIRRADALIVAPVVFIWGFGPFALGLRLAVGVSERARDYSFIAGYPNWSRGPFRFEAGPFVGVKF